MSEELTLVKQERFQGIVKTAQSALLSNQSSVQKAVEHCTALLDTISGEGMNDELDAACNTTLVKLRKTDQNMKDRRTPVTQLFDAIKKEFTTEEAKIKELQVKLKTYRDAYAKEKAEAQRKREAEAQRKLNIEKERTRIASEAEVKLSEFFNNILESYQKEMLGIFNNATLDTFVGVGELLTDYSLQMNTDKYNAFTFQYYVNFISRSDAELIIKQVKETKHGYYANMFSEKVDEFRQDLIDKLPSKKTELEAIAEAEQKDAEEAERLRQLREKREREEAERLANERKQREANEKAKAEAKAEEANMNNLFNATEQTVESSASTPVRSGYEITITHPAAWVQIFQLWFEKEGKNLAIDVAGRRSLNQMKGWCEKIAHKEGIKIESPYVKYEESYSTVAKA